MSEFSSRKSVIDVNEFNIYKQSSDQMGDWMVELSDDCIYLDNKDLQPFLYFLEEQECQDLYEAISLLQVGVDFPFLQPQEKQQVAKQLNQIIENSEDILRTNTHGS